MLEDYKRLRHYNLAELTKPETEKSENAETDKPGEAETDKPDEAEDGESDKEEEDTEVEEALMNKDSGNSDEAKAVESEGKSSTVVTSCKPDETPT